MSEVVVKITLDSSGAVSGARRTNRALSTVGRSGRQAAGGVRTLGAALKSLWLYIAPLLALGKAVQLVAGAFRAAADEQGALRRFEQALANTGNATRTTSEELTNFADRLSKATGTAADEIVEAAAMIAMDGLDNEIFYRSIELANDMAAAWGGNLRTNMEGLSRAIGDPVKGFAMLRMRGIQLTDQQAALVSQLMESNDVIGAQRVVLESLEAQVKGIAEAGADPMKQLQESARVLGKEMGGPLVGAINEVAIRLLHLAQRDNTAKVFRWIGQALAWVVRWIGKAIDFLDALDKNALVPARRGVARFVRVIEGALRTLANFAARAAAVANALGPLGRGFSRAFADMSGSLNRAAGAVEAYGDAHEEMTDRIEANAEASARSRAEAQAQIEAQREAVATTRELTEETEELTDSTNKAATALQKAAERVREYRRALAELRGEARSRIVDLEREAWLLERNLRIWRAIIEVQARGVPRAEGRELNQMADEFVRRQAVLRRLQAQAAGEAFGAIQLVDIPEIEGQEEVVLSILQRLAIAGGDFQRRWGAVADAIAGTFGNLSSAMQGFYEASGEQSETAFELYRAFAIGEAIAATYSAATKALDEVPFPASIGAATSIILMGLANVAKIRAATPGGDGAGGGTSTSASPLSAGMTLAQSGARRSGDRPAAAPPITVNVQTENRIEAVDGFAIRSKVREADRVMAAGTGRGGR